MKPTTSQPRGTAAARTAMYESDASSSFITCAGSDSASSWVPRRDATGSCQRAPWGTIEHHRARQHVHGSPTDQLHVGEVAVRPSRDRRHSVAVPQHRVRVVVAAATPHELRWRTTQAHTEPHAYSTHTHTHTRTHTHTHTHSRCDAWGGAQHDNAKLPTTLHLLQDAVRLQVHVVNERLQLCSVEVLHGPAGLHTQQRRATVGQRRRG
jgi:hypothetical protein